MSAARLPPRSGVRAYQAMVPVSPVMLVRLAAGVVAGAIASGASDRTGGPGTQPRELPNPAAKAIRSASDKLRACNLDMMLARWTSTVRGEMPKS